MNLHILGFTLLIVMLSTNVFAEYYYNCCEAPTMVYINAHARHHVGYKHKKIRHVWRETDIRVVQPAAHRLSGDWVTYGTTSCACMEVDGPGCQFNPSLPNEAAMYPSEDLWVPGYKNNQGEWMPGHWRY